MNGTREKRETAYKQYVFQNVADRAGERWAAFSYEQLAELVGLKPTHNFKRRIREMADQGLIKKITAFTERGGLTVLFHAPSIEPSEIPF